MINIVVIKNRNTGHLLLNPLCPHLIFSTLSCAPGDCPWWAVSLALRLLVGSGKWEILDVAGPEEGEEKGCISLVSSLPGHHGLALGLYLSVHTPVWVLVTTTSLLPTGSRRGNCSPPLLAPGYSPKVCPHNFANSVDL